MEDKEANVVGHITSTIKRKKNLCPVLTLLLHAYTLLVQTHIGWTSSPQLIQSSQPPIDMSTDRLAWCRQCLSLWDSFQVILLYQIDD